MPVINILIVIFVIGGMLYSAGALVIALALLTKRYPVTKSKPSVSVVIAARNERDAIGPCLASLSEQDYPDGLAEIIVADDRSDDGTSDILAVLRKTVPNLRIIRIDKAPHGISPKKHALKLAIGVAEGEIILQTDADCIVPPGWLAGMTALFTDDTAMVAGLSPYRRGRGMLNSFIRHEYLWNAALAAGSIAFGFGTHATGRNLSFRRDVFERAGGYGSNMSVASGDDTLLLQRIRRLPGARIAFASDTSTHVATDAPQSFAAFLRQRIRHMSTGRRFDPVLIVLGGAVYAFHILLAALLVMSPWAPTAFGLFLAMFSAKMLVDIIVALSVRRSLGLEAQWFRFPLNELLLLLYMAVMPLLGLIIPVKWKENS